MRHEKFVDLFEGNLRICKKSLSNKIRGEKQNGIQVFTTRKTRKSKTATLRVKTQSLQKTLTKTERRKSVFQNQTKPKPSKNEQQNRRPNKHAKMECWRD